MRWLWIILTGGLLFILNAPIFCLDSAAKPDVAVVARAVKICQLVGEFDRERNEPAPNKTKSRFKLFGTDLGVPFRHKDRTYLVFGDTVGARPLNADSIAYTTDTNPEDGITLEFIHDPDGTYRPVKIPGISQGGFEVPMEGTSVNGRMYIYHTTDSTGPGEMGRSVVAVSRDDGWTFKYLYDLSRKHFINVSVVEYREPLPASATNTVQAAGPALFLFGSGRYRRSDVHLALQPASRIEDRGAIRYFAGLDAKGEPIFNPDEEEAAALFHQPCVGELSVTYNSFLGKWLMLYNCSSDLIPGCRELRGINMRTADQPWGPWSEPQVIFEPWADNGYGYFMHVSWKFKHLDEVHDPGRENEWAGEYGPYQLGDLAVGRDGETTIYFTMSTWNPYTVVLMKAVLKREV